MLKKDEYFIKDEQSVPTIEYIARKCLSQVEAMYYKICQYLYSNNVQEKKYNVSICAIFKNEAQYLKEWIEFNNIVGVEHFYLYNNNSDDDFEPVLKPYIKNGLVTLIDWPQNQMQMECYQACIRDYANETKWLGFIDIDEFVIPKSTDSVYDFLKKFEKKAGAVKLYWRLFGTSGRRERDLTGLICEDFTVCWPKYYDVGKCFYNTAFGFDSNSKYAKQLHHRFWANYRGKNIPPVNVFNHICVRDRNIADEADFPIQINHYFTKSYEEYLTKCAKGDVYYEINPHDEKYFDKHEMKCTSVDYSAYKYLMKLKLRME